MKKKVLIVLAEGFEEIEAVTPMDILRRAGMEVVVASLADPAVRGSHGVTVDADMRIEEVDFTPDAVVLPGGLPGAEHLASSVEVKDLIKSMDSQKMIIAAICASPALVLTPTGILDGRKATCYPGMEESFSPKVKYVTDPVVQDGHVITSRGPATALPFALKIVEALVGKSTADTLAKAVLLG